MRIGNGKWKLKRTKQCKNCPWREDSNLTEIPGYDRALHSSLNAAIAAEAIIENELAVMVCHESTANDYCVGWLRNQLDNNNITLRIKMMRCENSREIEVFGKQHPTFEQTKK